MILGYPSGILICLGTFLPLCRSASMCGSRQSSAEINVALLEVQWDSYIDPFTGLSKKLTESNWFGQRRREEEEGGKVEGPQYQ